MMTHERLHRLLLFLVFYPVFFFFIFRLPETFLNILFRSNNEGAILDRRQGRSMPKKRNQLLYIYTQIMFRPKYNIHLRSQQSPNFNHMFDRYKRQTIPRAAAVTDLIIWDRQFLRRYLLFLKWVTTGDRLQICYPK